MQHSLTLAQATGQSPTRHRIAGGRLLPPEVAHQPRRQRASLPKRRFGS